MTLRILHLVGSATSEFYCDLSRFYAKDCLQSVANPRCYEFFIAYITPDRQWRFPVDLSREAIAKAHPLSLGEAIQTLGSLKIDLMVPHMFCVPGMTHYRGLFDLLGIPYLGNTPDVMALTAHKAKTKAVVAAAGVQVPLGELVRPGQTPAIAPPVVLKPVDADNSLGVSFVADACDYAPALQAAFRHGNEILVEAFIALGREVRCGILVQGEKLMCLPLEEYQLDPNQRPIRSYADKLQRNETGELSAVAKNNEKSWIVDREDPVTERVWEAAKQCHVALGCRHYSLFDFRIDPDGNPWFLEAGLYCSFASQSVISTAAKAAQIPLASLFQIAIDSALSTHPSTQGR